MLVDRELRQKPDLKTGLSTHHVVGGGCGDLGWKVKEEKRGDLGWLVDGEIEIESDVDSW